MENQRENAWSLGEHAKNTWNQSNDAGKQGENLSIAINYYF